MTRIFSIVVAITIVVVLFIGFDQAFGNNSSNPLNQFTNRSNGHHGGNSGNECDDTVPNPNNGNSGHNRFNPIRPGTPVDGDIDGDDDEGVSSVTRHLYFSQVDAVTGDPISGSAWGEMTYTAAGTAFRFVFNGHHVEPGCSYALVYLPDPLPGEGLVCLGSGTANKGGNVHIMNMGEGVDSCDFPIESDGNYAEGARIMLVAGDDIDCETGMLSWNPEKYLVGCELISFDDTDGCSTTPPEESIDVETSTNGEDADEPAGPILRVGDPVEWTYVVTNTGDQELTDITVVDSQGAVVSCTAIMLAPGESMTCTAEGIAVEGQYENVGTVTATLPDGDYVSDSDPSHYYGVFFLIDWASLLSPMSITHTISAVAPTEPIISQVLIQGISNVPGVTPGLLAQVGYGPDGSQPENNASWRWVDAVFSADVDDKDEFQGQLLPEPIGTYDVAYRYSSTNGLTWGYADLDSTENGYDPAQAGELIVLASDDGVAPFCPENLIVSGVTADAVTLSWDAGLDADIYAYEVLRATTAGGPYSLCGTVLATTTEYTDTTVVSGAAHFYVVRAVDTAFNRSEYSNEVSNTAQP
nr:fibronectin type III domain-containing protein [Deltaproteobacteria bacterium]